MAKDFYFQDPWQWLSLYASIMFMLRYFASWFSYNGKFRFVIKGLINSKKNSSTEGEKQALLDNMIKINSIARMEDADIVLLVLNGLSGIVFCLIGIFVNLWFNDALTGKGIPPGFMDLDDKVRMGYSLSSFILMLLDVPVILNILYLKYNSEVLIAASYSGAFDAVGITGALDTAGGWCKCGGA